MPEYVISLKSEQNFELPFRTGSAQTTGVAIRNLLRALESGASKAHVSMSVREVTQNASVEVMCQQAGGVVGLRVNGVEMTMDAAGSDTETLIGLATLVNSETDARVANHVEVVGPNGATFQLVSKLPGTDGHAMTCEAIGEGVFVSSENFEGGQESSSDFTF